jgi:exodeoxyribonuclease VII small subunit
MSEELSFEKALEKLEKIVAELESGDVALEDALKKYEQGVKLSRACQARLSQAEKKISVLARALDGGLVKEPYEPSEEEEGGAETKPGRKAKRAPREAQTGGEDLLL